MGANGKLLFVPTSLTPGQQPRGVALCEDFAGSQPLGTGIDLGYESVTILDLDDTALAGCSVPRNARSPAS